MKSAKNTPVLILMTSSIVLLLALQAFWLHNSYEKAFQDFRRETSSIFRNTVFSMRDSIFSRSIVPMKGDSNVMYFNNRDAGKLHAFVTSDTFVQRKNGQEHSTEIQVYLSSTSDNDSIKDLLKPLVGRIKEGGQKNFIIRIGPDSLNTDSIAYFYKNALAKSSLDVSFQIKSQNLHRVLLKRQESFRGDVPPFLKFEETQARSVSYGDTLTTDFVGVNPMYRYAAFQSGVRSFLLREIMPQILFSIFLTVITIASFVFMYRNIRTQQRLMEAKNEFISNVTHELKTPVATVSVALEALKNFSAMDNPKLREEYLDMATRELDRLSVMTDKILDTSIFESQGVPFEPEQTNLDNIIQEMMISMKMAFEKRNAQVIYTKKGNNFEILGGSIHLTNVIYNLIDNALKYSGEKPLIDITLKDENQKLVISVKDNGIGIAPEYLHKIFEKFFRTPSGDVHNSKGYGLGLSYVDSVVKSHYGVMDVVSKLNEGSTFIITIPRSPGKIFKKDFRIGPAKNHPPSES